MNWAALIPILADLLKSLGTGLGTPTPPGPPGTVLVVPDQAIKDLQTLLNVLGQTPPLVVDGWLGPLTDAAIETGIAKLKAALPKL